MAVEHGHRSSEQSTPAHDADTAVIGAGDDAPLPGGFGRYVVLEEIGRGAMGRVLRAYDPKLQREVALKEVRRRDLGTAGAQRLVTEARAMAQLAHPNVVAVYDVEEVEPGRFVLVMEYVPGRTLREWLDTPRSWREVVARFIDAGRGLAAAHAAALLHRDFKPDNVLVTEGDVVKVTDFGLAKVDPGDTFDELPQASTSEVERLTQTGVVLGTPRYMAPEQHRGDPLTPAADQYAYCVALWEALIGDAPFRAEKLERSKAKGPPPWPGGPTPRRVVAAIVRGLAVDPSRRWPSMQALLGALDYDPAEIRRRWIGAASVVGVLALGAVGSWAWTVARAERCTADAAAAHLDGVWDETRREQVHTAMSAIDTAYAEAAWKQSVPVLDAYADAWVQMHVEACEQTSVRGEQSAAVLDLRMACLQRAKVELAAVSDVLADADARAVEQAHALVGSLPAVERCADVAALQADVEPPPPEEADAVAQLHAHLGAAKAARLGRRKERALEELEAAKTILAGIDYAPAQVDVALEEGHVLAMAGDYPGAEAAMRRVLALAATQQRWTEMSDAATNLLFVVGYRQQRFDVAWSYAELARGLAETDADQQAALSTAVAAVLDAQGEYAKAEAEHRRALELRLQVRGPDDREVAQARVNIAKTLLEQGEYAAAEADFRAALSVFEAALGSDHAMAVNARSNLAVALLRQGKLKEAEAEYRRVLALHEETVGPEHENAAQMRADLTLALSAQGKYAESEVELRRAIDLLVKAIGADHPRVAGVRSNLALVLAQQGKLREAEAEVRSALAVMQKALGPEHPDVALQVYNLGEFLQAQGRLEEAEVESRRAIDLIERALGAEHVHVPTARIGLARLLLERGEHEEARRIAEEVWARVETDANMARQRALTMHVVARARWETGNATERRAAVELAEKAVAEYLETGQGETDQAVEAKAWLESHRG